MRCRRGRGRRGGERAGEMEKRRGGWNEEEVSRRIGGEGG